jgi:hypothetical protein
MKQSEQECKRLKSYPTVAPLHLPTHLLGLQEIRVGLGAVILGIDFIDDLIVSSQQRSAKS